MKIIVNGFWTERVDLRRETLCLLCFTCSTLVKTIVYAAWYFRSRAVFRHIHNNCHGIIRYIKEQIHFRLWGDFVILNRIKFRSLWCDSSLCRVDNNDLLVNFR